MFTFVILGCKQRNDPPELLDGQIPIGSSVYFCKNDNPMNYVENFEGKLQVQITSTSNPQVQYLKAFNGGANADMNTSTNCLMVKFPYNTASTLFIRFKELSTQSCDMGGTCQGWFHQETLPAYSKNVTCNQILFPVIISQPQFAVDCNDY